MKHGILALLFTFLSIGLSAQEGFKLGIQGGLPLADFNDEVAITIGLDVGYMYALGEVVDLGIMTGFVHGFAETFHTNTVLTDLPDVQFLPLAGSVRIWPSNSFSFGVDAGQAFGINEGNEGGLYYRPLIALLMGPKTEVNLSYTGIQLDDKVWSTANLGVIYTFTSRRSR